MVSLPNRVSENLVGMGKTIKADLPRAVFRTGAQLRTAVRARASGRPGPRVITGNYRRSIAQTNTTDLQGNPTAYVHTNAPQAMRLEYGFVGIDAAGRMNNSPPYPHWAPAVRDIEGVLEREVNAAITRAVNIWKVGR